MKIEQSGIIPTGVLTGQILMVFGIVLMGVWTATQWTAAALGYQLRLGLPWFHLLRIPVYYPWRLFEWWYVYEAYASSVFIRGGAIAASGGLFGTLFAVLTCASVQTFDHVRLRQLGLNARN